MKISEKEKWIKEAKEIKERRELMGQLKDPVICEDREDVLV